MATVLTSDLTLTTTAGGTSGGVLTVASTGDLRRGMRGWLRDASNANPLEIETIAADDDVNTFQVRRIDRDASGRELQSHVIPDLTAYLTGSTASFPAQETEANEVEDINENIDMDGLKVVDLADPSDNQDAATKAYVDSAATSAESNAVTTAEAFTTAAVAAATATANHLDLIPLTADPSPPAAGKVRFYFRGDTKQLCVIDENGAAVRTAVMVGP